MIAIIGGGCSGVLAAISLLREAPDEDLIVIESREDLGRGMAYSTPWYEHLLNVPAAKMSALPSEPSHFAEWLTRRGWPPTCGSSFVPRRVYGDYLGDVLRTAVARAEQSFRHIRSEVEDLELTPRGIRLVLQDGSSLHAGRAVLALGNPPPRPLAALAGFDAGENCFPSLWCPGAVELHSREENVLLIGSGLTAMDAVLALAAAGHTGTVQIVSRRGQLPQPHRTAAQEADPGAAPQPAGLRALLHNLRQEAVRRGQSGENWRHAVDSLRPVTNALWEQLSLAEQRRFLRHLKAYWDTHRHRMAPEVADAVEHYRHQGRLRVCAGRLLSVYRGERGLEVSIARRRGGELRVEADRIINCTGIEEKYTESSRPLIRSLAAGGLAAVNRLGTGFSADSSGALIDARGRISNRLFTLGPTRSGDLIETVAVPEIRQQADILARYLGGAGDAIGSPWKAASPSPSGT